MAKRRLAPTDIDQLLVEKRSERRRLNFQLRYVRSAIQQLQQLLKAIGRKAPEQAAVYGVKRRPGRPRKNPQAIEGQPAKRGPGRPRKHPLPEQPQLKRGPGRPRKNPLPAQPPPVKQGPGRPRKNPLPEAAPVKRRPGRPRKDGLPPGSAPAPAPKAPRGRKGRG